MGDIDGGKRAAGPRLVFHDDRLPQRLCQFVRDDAHLHIGTAAGRERNDNAKPARRPILGVRHARKRCQQKQRKHEANDVHGVSSVKNSFSDSEVLSVWTPAEAENGPAERRISNPDPAPYV